MEPEKKAVPPARLVLPTRTPVAPVRREPPKLTPVPAAEPSSVMPRRPAVTPLPTSPLLQPLPKPPGIALVPNLDRGPRKDTARINIPPGPTTTQPVAHSPIPLAPVVLTSRPITSLETIPRPLCWTLASISAVIFLIQIWNYVVS